MKNICLSIILPCYNVEKYIAACLDSIHRQDLPEDVYEVICVDDCSTDSTKDIIYKYQKIYSNISLINHKVNMSAGGARNTGLEVAVGDYVWFVDPDDMLIDNTIIDAINKCKENKLDILCFNFKNVIALEDNILDADLIYHDSEICDGYTFIQKFGGQDINKHTIVWQRIYRRKFIEDNFLRFPLIKVSEDAVFSWKALFAATRVQSEITSRYIYRSNDDSVTAPTNINADKVYAKDILFPLELLKWIQSDITIKNDIRETINEIISNFVSVINKDYLILNKEERKKLYNLLKTNCLLSIFIRYIGLRKKLLYTSLYVGESMFRFFCNKL